MVLSLYSIRNNQALNETLCRGYFTGCSGPNIPNGPLGKLQERVTIPPKDIEMFFLDLFSYSSTCSSNVSEPFSLLSTRETLGLTQKATVDVLRESSRYLLVWSSFSDVLAVKFGDSPVFKV